MSISEQDGVGEMCVHKLDDVGVGWEDSGEIPTEPPELSFLS